MSSELPDPQSPSTESPSQLILLSQSTETQPSTSENESHLQSVSTESPTTSQPAPICESIDLQSATLQDISDVFEPEVSDNNFVTQDVNISTDNIVGKNDNEVVCIFCNKKKKKVRSIKCDFTILIELKIINFVKMKNDINKIITVSI